MRGLAVVTSNSTYLFNDDQVMFISHDSTSEKDLGDGVYLISGQWYSVTRKPTEPEYDSLDFGNGACNYRGISFGFINWNMDEPAMVTTSRVKEWAYLGDGEAADVFLSRDDKLQIVRDLIAKNADSLTISDGWIGAKIAATALVRHEFPNMSLVEARELVLDVQATIKVSTTVTFKDEADHLDEPRRRLTGVLPPLR